MILEERILHKKYIVLLLLILISLLSINAISAEEIENNNNLITTSGVNSLGTSNIQSTGLENNEDNDVTIDENDTNEARTFAISIQKVFDEGCRPNLQVKEIRFTQEPQQE